MSERVVDGRVAVDEVDVAFGRLMRLAKDWEFVETWSSGMNLERWEPADGLLFGDAAPPAAARSDEYDCAFPKDAERPLAPGGLESLVAARDAERRGSPAGWEPVCSNFFFMSLTLARAAAGTALPVAERSRVPSVGVGSCLSSTGLEAERCMGLVGARVPGAVGSLEGFPLLVDVDREGGAWRLDETAEAIESWVGSETRLCFAA